MGEAIRSSKPLQERGCLVVGRLVELSDADGSTTLCFEVPGTDDMPSAQLDGLPTNDPADQG